MSGHFVYELDERKLRVKLQELEVELKPEAWSDFELYYKSTTKPKNENPFQRLQIPFSMNIFLPVLFGGIIIIIAVFLFKFINIKNLNDGNKQPEIDKTLNQAINLDTTKKQIQTNSLSPIDSSKAVTITSTLNVDNEKKISSKNDSVKAAFKNTNFNNGKSNTKDLDTLQLAKTQAIQVTKSETTNVNKDSTKSKKKKQRKTVNDSTQEKILEEIPNTLDESDASLKPN